MDRSHAWNGRPSWGIASSVPNPPTSSDSFASLAPTVAGLPTTQMLSRRYSGVMSAVLMPPLIGGFW